MGAEVTLVVKLFFVNGKIEQPLNSNIIILIHMVNGSNNMSGFRPIVLVNFIFKIICKILADRISLITGKMISSN